MDYGVVHIVGPAHWSVAILGFLCVCAPTYNICVYISAHQSADLVTMGMSPGTV